MTDGVRTDRAAVDDCALIKRLNISIPFSPTDGEVRYDQRLQMTKYKGFFIIGYPRSEQPGRYWFKLRGSLIKIANGGSHNHDYKDPFQLLYALDDLVTSLRINPFKTPLNGLELSTTIRVANSYVPCFNIASYLNYSPHFNNLSVDRGQMPYVQVEAKHHKLKLYAPAAGLFRVEVKINKMQYLGPNRPQTFADLVQPCYAAPLAKKLLAAYKKIIWKCSDLDPDCLIPAERELYLKGRLHDYWQVQRKDYENDTQFKCAEKRRSREKDSYNEIVRRHWLSEPPVYLEQLIREQLNRHGDLMHTSLYKTMLEVCLERWEYVGSLPGIERLPNRLKLSPLSEIYPLYFGKFSTPAKSTLNKRWESAKDLSDQPEKTAAILQGHKTRKSTSDRPQQTKEEQAHKRQRNQASNSPNNELSRVKKAINAPGGLIYTLDEMSPLLTVKTRTALAYSGQSLNELKLFTPNDSIVLKPSPLF